MRWLFFIRQVLFYHHGITNYTLLHIFYVKTSGIPTVPPAEKLTIDYLTPAQILKKENVAKPEKTATKKLISLKLI